MLHIFYLLFFNSTTQQKDFEMKHIILLTISILCLTSINCTITDQNNESWNLWYENGKKSHSFEMKDGKPHGEATYWHDNGKIAAKGKFKKGTECGKWEFYTKNGIKTTCQDNRFDINENIQLRVCPMGCAPSGPIGASCLEKCSDANTCTKCNTNFYLKSDKSLC